MKPGDKIAGGICKPGKPCGVLAQVLRETHEQRPKGGGAGLAWGLTIGASISPILYSTGKGTRKAPATHIRIEWCPFCRGPLTAQAAAEIEAAGSFSRAKPRPPRAADDAKRIGDVRERLILWMLHGGWTAWIDDAREAKAGTVWELGAWVREKLDARELPEELRQDLGLAHLDTCEHYACPACPCDGGEGCGWVADKPHPEYVTPACKCGAAGP